MIDNEKHIMYWLDVCGVEYSLETESVRCESKLIALDIENLNDIKLILNETISAKDFPRFGHKCYKMLIVGHTIQFVLGGKTRDKERRIKTSDAKWMHYEFEIKTHKLKLVHDNIHVSIGEKNRVTRSKVLNLFDNLAIGDWVDVKDSLNNFYLAIIVDIKDKKFAIDAVDDVALNKKKVKSMKIKVLYIGCDNKYNEWININSDVTTDMSLCDCVDKCVFSHNLQESLNEHRLTLPNTQSKWSKHLNGLNAVYSKSYKKMIIFGCNTQFPCDNSTRKWRGFYYKYLDRDRDYKDYKLITDGFIRQFETMVDNTFVNIPKDIHEMIFRYYFIPNDDDWTQATEKDNAKFIDDMFSNHFYKDSGCVLINNDNDIFMFGGTLRNTNQRHILNVICSKCFWMVDEYCMSQTSCC